MSLTQALAALIVDTLPSADAREKARAGLLDFLAVTLPVTRGDIDDSGLKSLRQVYRANDAQSRALRLGYAGHALDFDDFHADFRGHPSTVILPALLALAAERADIDGDRFLDAYVIGVEAAGRLGLAAGPRHYTLGFHSTATLGTIAAAAACARFVGAGARDTAVILGIAATQASGLRAQFGSEAKPLHAGLAAQAAVSATLLALSGFHGQADKVLDAFHRLLRRRAANGKTDCRLGGAVAHCSPGAGIQTLADLRRNARRRRCRARYSPGVVAAGKNIAGLQQELERVEVSFPPGGDIAASVRQPTNGIEARFSLEYVIAASLLRETLLLADFSQGALDEEIAALAQTVARRPDLTAPPDELNPANRFHQVTIFLRTGETLQKRFTRQQSLAIPFDLAGKVDTCLSHATDTQREEVVALSRLESRDSLPRLTDLLFTER
jgi:2-methylcitrate dehydratase PrpD